MHKPIDIQITKISSSECTALTLLGVSTASAASLLNQYFPLPQLVFIGIWLSVLVLLWLALARSIFEAWSSHNLSSKFFIFILIATVYGSFFKVTSSGFIRHDEIYSWGMWGVQHALRQSYDLHYTSSPYPQLFAYEIGSVFTAQGNHTEHFFAKLITGLPSILTLILLGEFISKSQHEWVNWLTLLLSVGAVISIGSPMYWAYADPLASTLLLTSFALILQYSREPEYVYLMVLASACALMASLAKQPGLVWCFASLPAITIYGIWQLGWKKLVLIPCLIAMVLATIWPFFIAPTFTNNQGVLEITKNNGGILASIFKSMFTYIISSPSLGIILIITTAIALANKTGRILWLFFVFPYMIIWFTFGSYEKRHGMHVILVSVALFNQILIKKYHFEKIKLSVNSKSSAIQNSIILGSALCIVISSIALAYLRNANLLKDGNREIFISQFGSDSAKIYDDIIANQNHVFTASNYQYGMLFNRTPLSRPDAGDIDSSTEKLINYLTSSEATYTFTSGEWSFGPYSAEIERLVKQCPEALKLIKTSTIYPHFSIYKINQEEIKIRCNK